MPSNQVPECTFHGYVARQLENDRLRVVVVPKAGAKIVSIFDKQMGVEWLVQPEHSNPFRAFEYGTEYNPNQCGGWDEMFPTILACPYPAPGAWQDIALPDHGELWMLPWQDEPTEAGVLHLTVEGRALPYRLSRSLSFGAENELKFRYDLHNLGKEPLVYLWTPHPQFLLEPGSTMILPPDVDEVINVLPKEWGAEWGGVGTHNAWPAIQLEGSDMLRQDVIAAASMKRGRKFYLPPDKPISWMGLRRPNGASLHMSWDPQMQPYCGVWIDEGILNSVCDVGIEPSSAYYDDLALAWNNQRFATLPPGESTAWPLHVSLSAEA